MKANPPESVSVRCWSTTEQLQSTLALLLVSGALVLRLNIIRKTFVLSNKLVQNPP